MFKAALLALLLSGCASIGPYSRSGEYPYGVAADAVVITRQPEVYTRAEVDAINAELGCRRLARNMLEAQRCGVRR